MQGQQARGCTASAKDTAKIVTSDSKVNVKALNEVKPEVTDQASCTHHLRDPTSLLSIQ